MPFVPGQTGYRPVAPRGRTNCLPSSDCLRCGGARVAAEGCLVDCSRLSFLGAPPPPRLLGYCPRRPRLPS